MTSPHVSPRIPTSNELEASLEAYFRREVRVRLGGKPVKLAPTEKGCPDRMVLLPGGRVHLVELKTERGRLSPSQRLWHARAGELGVDVAVLYGRGQIDEWIAARAADYDQPARGPRQQPATLTSLDAYAAQRRGHRAVRRTSN